MNKSVIAAFAAASVIGFGAVGSAFAETTISGFANVTYNALEDTDSLRTGALGTGEEGNFAATGEIDVINEMEGVTARFDLDILNILDREPQADSTFIGVVDVEQANIDMKLNDMIGVTAGIFNSPFGLEGQDHPDIRFAQNGLLWYWVPSNLAGAEVTVMPNEMASLKVGYTNARTDISGGFISDRGNDWNAVLTVMPMEGFSGTIGYMADETETLGDQLNINVTADLGAISAAAEYMSGDPGTATGNFDNGWGLRAAYTMSGITGAVRYESASFEGTAPDQTWTSIAVGYAMSENCTVRVDWTNQFVDTTGGLSADEATVQLLHTF